MYGLGSRWRDVVLILLGFCFSFFVDCLPISSWKFLEGVVRHLLPHAEADNANLWRPEPLGISSHVRGDLLLALPRTAELRPAQDCRELGAVPAAALLHDRLRTADLPRVAAVPCSDGA